MRPWGSCRPTLEETVAKPPRTLVANKSLSVLGLDELGTSEVQAASHAQVSHMAPKYRCGGTPYRPRVVESRLGTNWDAVPCGCGLARRIVVCRTLSWSSGRTQVALGQESGEGHASLARRQLANSPAHPTLAARRRTGAVTFLLAVGKSTFSASVHCLLSLVFRDLQTSGSSVDGSRRKRRSARQASGVLPPWHKAGDDDAQGRSFAAIGTGYLEQYYSSAVTAACRRLAAERQGTRWSRRLQGTESQQPEIRGTRSAGLACQDWAGPMPLARLSAAP